MDQLPGKQRAHLEQAFAMDLSGVNVHPDSPEATAVGAEAFARGPDLHFAPGRFAPGTESGDTLIAHEVAHVAQQAEGRVRSTLQAKGMPVNLEPELEDEADRMAADAMAGRPARSSTNPLSAPQGPGVAQGSFAYKGKILRPGDGLQNDIHGFLLGNFSGIASLFAEIASDTLSDPADLDSWLTLYDVPTVDEILDHLKARLAEKARARKDEKDAIEEKKGNDAGDDSGDESSSDDPHDGAPIPVVEIATKKRKRSPSQEGEDEPEPKKPRPPRTTPLKVKIGKTTYTTAETFHAAFKANSKAPTPKQKRSGATAKPSQGLKAKSAQKTLGLTDDQLVEGLVLLTEAGANVTFSTWGPGFVQAASGALRAERSKDLKPVVRTGHTKYATPGSKSTYDPSLLTPAEKKKRNELLRKQGSEVVEQMEFEKKPRGKAIMEWRKKFPQTPGLQSKRKEMVRHTPDPTSKKENKKENKKVPFAPTTYSVQNGNFLIGGGGGSSYQELITSIKCSTGLKDAAIAERLLGLLINKPSDMSELDQYQRALLDKFEAIFRFAETRRASLSVVSTIAALNHVVRTDEDLYETLRRNTLHVKTETTNSTGGAKYTRFHKQNLKLNAKDAMELESLAAAEYDLIMAFLADNGVDVNDEEKVTEHVKGFLAKVIGGIKSWRVGNYVGASKSEGNDGVIEDSIESWSGSGSDEEMAQETKKPKESPKKLPSFSISDSMNEVVDEKATDHLVDEKATDHLVDAFGNPIEEDEEPLIGDFDDENAGVKAEDEGIDIDID